MFDFVRAMPWLITGMIVLYVLGGTLRQDSYTDQSTGMPVHRESQGSIRWAVPDVSGGGNRPATMLGSTGISVASLVGGSDTAGGRGPGTGKSLAESGGWFDEPDADWEIRKAHVKDQLRYRKFYPFNTSGWKIAKDNNNLIFQFDWRAVMECPEKVTLQNSKNMEAKYLCGALRLTHAKKCVVYSIGSRGEYDFEEMIYKMNKNCEIFVFDHDPKFGASAPHFIKYNGVGLGSTDPSLTRGPAGYKYETLPAMMARLGHTEIDVLKIDCDGCEYNIYEQLGMIKYKQLLIEIHHYPHKQEGNEFWKYIKMMDAFVDYGLVPVERELNAAYMRKGPDGTMQVWAAEYVYLQLQKGLFDTKTNYTALEKIKW